MNLHENQDLFQQSISITAQQKGLPEIYIEIDYWVTVALLTPNMACGMMACLAHGQENYPKDNA